MSIPLFPDQSVDENWNIPNILLFVDEFEAYFDEQVVGEIQKAVDNEMGAAAYILISCAIDCLASFWCGQDSNAKTYKKFVRRFLKAYSAEYLYRDLRCRLVHNYTLGQNLIMCWSEPDLHSTLTEEGKKVINLEQFFQDFQQAKRHYFEAVRQDLDLQLKLANRWLDVGILSPICPDSLRESRADT